ncbi:Hypothetical predicted protein [Octopus vulgaris]|uniref:Uncharacterized protein n=1 Tax=Octopus vulgaris TaxID=6645 RepID=A0AA36AUD8_OCTVU|nr:Hypothetical predicted protein [Octopus vulgaris]
MCVFMSETPKLHAAPAEGNGELLLTLLPQLSFTLSSCILQLTCDGPASCLGGEPMCLGNRETGTMSQAWLEKEQTTTYIYIYIHTHTHTYIYIHIYTHTHTHIYIYISSSSSSSFSVRFPC